MQKVSKKILSVIVAFVLVLGMFSAVLPTLELSSAVKAEETEWTYVYADYFSGKDSGTNVVDTRVLANPNGITQYGIFHSLGLAARQGGQLGVSDEFFAGTGAVAVGAKPEEIHPYIVYNVVPNTEFKLLSAEYTVGAHTESGCDLNERFFNLYVSNDGVTWIPIDCEKENLGVWNNKGSYEEYLYTIENVGTLTNFVKVEYPMSMASKRPPNEEGKVYYPNESTMVRAVKATIASEYSANGETFFEAMAYGLQKELWEEYFIAFPDVICNDSPTDLTNLNNAYKAGTTGYGMLTFNGGKEHREWGTYPEDKNRSLITMVKPGTRFYLETANSGYMRKVGKALVDRGEIASADLARIRVYSSATLSDNAEDWTEWQPMPYASAEKSIHTPTFNFYLPKDHIYVRIVYPQKGSFASLNTESYTVTDECGNTGCFFNDMVFTPYSEGKSNYSYDYSNTTTKGYVKSSNIVTGDSRGLRVTNNSLIYNLPDKKNYNTTKKPYSDDGYYSVTYEVQGGKMFSLEYIIRNTTANGNTKWIYERNVEKDTSKWHYKGNGEINNSKMEFEISASIDGVNWYNYYQTESGYASSSVKISSMSVLDVKYLVPEDAKYVRVSFDILGNGYVSNNSGEKVTQYFNDGMYIRKVSVADANNVADNEQAGVYYDTLDSSNIESTMKPNLMLYHTGGVSVVNSAGIKANKNNAFVIYKIKEGTSLTIKTNDELAFEYSVDDKTYKKFDAIKVHGGYKIPAISNKNYIKVMLSNGQAISYANCELLPPTVNFYVPYLDKSYQMELENYGDTATNLTPTASMLRPGYTFNGWENEGNTDQIYIDTTFKAIYTKTDDVTYTVTYTVGSATTTKANVKFDDRVTVSAPETNGSGQVFSKWVDGKGTMVSDNANFSFLASGDVDLTAVYADSKESFAPYIYTTNKAVITTNENGTWNMSVIWRTAMPKGVKIQESGIILGTDADSANLVLWEGKVQSGTYKMVHKNAYANKTTMYTVKNIAADKVRSARPYARLTNGTVVYGDMVKSYSGANIESDFDFYGSFSPDVLSNYLDRSLTYHVVDGGEYGAKDVIRQTNAKYFARALCHWNPSIYDVNRFETYKKNIAEIHQMDPEIILEACIFETCGPKMNEIPIPAWVLEKFEQPVVQRNFDYEKMMHTAKDPNGIVYGYKNWTQDQTDPTKMLHVPSISTLEFQMFVYYRACRFIDMGVEAIHFGQMNLIGGYPTYNTSEKKWEIKSFDKASWTKVIDMINAYAKTNARRGYLIVNGHFPYQNLTRSDNSNKMLVDFNMFPFRFETVGSDHVATEGNPQKCQLNTTSTTDAPYGPRMQPNTVNKTSPSGYTYTNYPYLLEFDNWGPNIKYLDKAQNYWGYDEISWYANQPASYRRQFLTDIALEVKNLTSAPNGHVCMVGRRTAFIYANGCSEYLENEYIKNVLKTGNFYNEKGEVTGPNAHHPYGIQLGIWDIRDVGDVDAVKAAWQAIGSYGTYYDYSQESDGENITIGDKDHEKEKYGISEFGGDFALGKNEVSGSRIITGICPGYNALKTAWNDSATAAYVIYKVKPGSVVTLDFYLNQNAINTYFSGKNFEFTVESSSSTTGGWSNAKNTASYTANDITLRYTVPNNCSYIKITFPQKGKSSASSSAPRGNDYARLMGIRFIAE